MNRFQVLVIDDDQQIRTLIDRRLKEEPYEVKLCGSGREGLALLNSQCFDAALIDIDLPDMSGIEVLEKLRGSHPETDAVIMTGSPQLETAVQALRLGAYDYLVKPLDMVSVGHLLRRILERRYLKREVISLRTRLAEFSPAAELVGLSKRMQDLRELIAAVAPSDSSVLIEGPSGTGKELIAGAIHRMSTRSKRPFVPINCAAIPRELIESELFGYKKGAFSGASGDVPGLFRSAEGGTVFLDEIGEMHLSMQPKLLRILQEGEVRAVGSSQVTHVDVRIIAATNQRLEAAVEAGTFRKDLYFRLNIVRIDPPPLNEIKEDIPELVMHFVRVLNRRFGRNISGITQEALDSLIAYDFPGNVRELSNIIERAFVLGAQEQIAIKDLPPLNSRVAAAGTGQSAAASAKAMDDFQRDLIGRTLQTHANDRQKAAEALGLSERTLYRRLKKLGLNQAV